MAQPQRPSKSCWWPAVELTLLPWRIAAPRWCAWWHRGRSRWNLVIGLAARWPSWPGAVRLRATPGPSCATAATSVVWATLRCTRAATPVSQYRLSVGRVSAGEQRHTQSPTQTYKLEFRRYAET